VMHFGNVIIKYLEGSVDDRGIGNPP